jgi:uncharacterized membrane protein YdbT with pleckstrin-like domain
MQSSTPSESGADGSVPFDWLALDDDETVVWSDTPHRMALVPPMLIGLPLSLVLIGIPLVIGSYLSHRNTNYVVTTAALYRKTGVLSRSVQRIEFDKVQDTSYRQSFLGGQFGYGTVDVSTAGGTGVEMSFGNVEDPQALQRRINERIGSDRGDGDDRDKAAVLDDILAELRAIRSAVENRSERTDGREHGPGADADPSGEGQGPEP